MSTLTLDPVEIERVCREEESSASGSYREVWFLGDVVIKRDCYGGETNQQELDFFLDFDGGSFEHAGHTWEVRLPQTAMVGEYLIMGKVKFPAIELSYYDMALGREQCNFCTYAKKTTYGGGMYTYYTHDKDCWGAGLLNTLDAYMSYAHGIGDTHTGNFMYDIYTRTIWFVDFAQ